MKPKTIICAALLLFLSLCTIPTLAATPRGNWALDPQRSRVGFVVTKLGYADVEGRFTRFTGNVVFDPTHPERSSIRWRVKVASVKTGETGRDRSLQGPDFFDSARHPELAFQSEQVHALAGGRLEVSGRITIKGRTRPLTIVASPAAGGAGFEARFALNRTEFDVRGGGIMGKLIGRQVRIHLVAVPGGETR